MMQHEDYYREERALAERKRDQERIRAWQVVLFAAAFLVTVALCGGL